MQIDCHSFIAATRNVFRQGNIMFESKTLSMFLRYITELQFNDIEIDFADAIPIMEND